MQVPRERMHLNDSLHKHIQLFEQCMLVPVPVIESQASALAGERTGSIPLLKGLEHDGSARGFESGRS